MIKFFRSIRKRSLSENKTGMYLIYAFGEIILVVVGILLALQVNNWNEKRKAYKQSKIYLSEYLKDLEENSNFIDMRINVCSEYMQYETWVLERTNYTSDQKDSIWIALGGH